MRVSSLHLPCGWGLGIKFRVLGFSQLSRFSDLPIFFLNDPHYFVVYYYIIPQHKQNAFNQLLLHGVWKIKWSFHNSAMDTHL